MVPEGFIPPHGGYRNLISCRKSEIIYDATVYFTNRFFDGHDRTVGQMIQAARSGKQDIIEGSMASGTSKENEITNVARASLEELLEDYRDLRVRGFAEWPSSHRYAIRLRELNRLPDADYGTFRKGIEHENPEISANVVVGLIKVCSLLLSRQIRRIESEFLEQGGIRERMTNARIRQRKKQ